MSLRIFIIILAVVSLAFCVRAADMGLSVEAQESLRLGHQQSVLQMPELMNEKWPVIPVKVSPLPGPQLLFSDMPEYIGQSNGITTVSYTHLRAHETGRNLVCRLLL